MQEPVELFYTQDFDDYTETKEENLWLKELNVHGFLLIFNANCDKRFLYLSFLL